MVMQTNLKTGISLNRSSVYYKFLLLKTIFLFSGLDTAQILGEWGLIFEDLYVNFLVALKKVARIYECILFEKQWKSLISRLFFARARDKKGFRKVSRNCEIILRLNATRALK